MSPALIIGATSLYFLQSHFNYSRGTCAKSFNTMLWANSADDAFSIWLLLVYSLIKHAESALTGEEVRDHTHRAMGLIHWRVSIFCRFYIHYRLYITVSCIFAITSIFTIILCSLQTFYFSIFYIHYFRWPKFSKGICGSLGGSKMAVGIYHSIKEGIHQLVKKSFDLHWWQLMAFGRIGDRSWKWR